jgi:hypothetical protein
VAKTTAPLFSLKASGQLGKSLVYMSWKGINDVRQYVIPANPKTAGQQTQRGFFTGAVNAWHTDGLTVLDVAAWNLFALASKVVASGFNMFTKFYVDAKVMVHTWVPLSAVVASAITATGATVTAQIASDGTSVLYIGTSNTSMLIPFVGTFAIDHVTFTVTGLSATTKYFFYIKNTAISENARTGIYTITTIA